MRTASLSQQRLVRGSVLVVVLWVCLGLVSVTLLFGHSMFMAFRASDHDVAGRQADQAIEGAARYAQMLFTNVETPGRIPDPLTYESEAVPVGEATFWILGRPDVTDSGATRGFGLIDEAGKLNLNTATLDMLAALPGMTEELAGAIIDWRDEDDDVTGSGAESETYLRRRPAYTAKNAPFETVDELGLLNGADPIVLYGEDANRNGVIEANEDDGERTPPSDNSDGKLDFGIYEYVTVFSREPTTLADGAERIDVTVPDSAEALRTLLTEKLSETRANEILAVFEPPDVPPDVNPPVTTTSVLDLVIRGTITAEEFELIGDALRNARVEGLINVNTASEVVLACVPGIGPEKAATLVATRLSRATPTASMEWVADVLDQADITLAGPHLTGRSYQISADIAAVGRHGRGYRRTRLVIDISKGEPRIIYRKDLGGLGWALGSDIRQLLAERTTTR